MDQDPERADTLTADSPVRKPAIQSSSGSADSSSIEIVIEGGNNLDHSKFRITSSRPQLEQIGELLRGRPKVDHRTVIASLLASAGAIVFTAAIGFVFQYVSWLNTVRVDDAKDRAVKAYAAYNQAINTISQRSYATLLFGSALQDFVNRNADPPTSTKDNARSISDVTFSLDRDRIYAYYDIVKTWNQGYDALLEQINYDLDRQINLMIDTNAINPVTSSKTNIVDCSQFITTQMKKVGYDQHSLKAQFAIIHFCFGKVHETITALRNKALADNNEKIDDQSVASITNPLDAIDSMSNVFQCYALRRVEFYISEISIAPIGPSTVYRRISSGIPIRTQAARDHLASADKQCDRP